MFGQSGRTKGPLLFFLGSVLLWAYPMYLLRVSVLRQRQRQRELVEKDNNRDRDNELGQTTYSLFH